MLEVYLLQCFSVIFLFVCSHSDAEALRLFAQQQYLQKRAIATEIGSAFHEILEQFKTCKSSEEKKKVASDMANETIGQ